MTRTRRRFDSTTTLGSMERRRCTGNDRTIPDLSIESTKTPSTSSSSSSSSKGMKSRGTGHGPIWNQVSTWPSKPRRKEASRDAHLQLFSSLSVMRRTASCSSRRSLGRLRAPDKIITSADVKGKGRRSRTLDHARLGTARRSSAILSAT